MIGGIASSTSATMTLRKPDAQEGDEEHDQPERGHRPADVRGRGGEELVAADVAEPERRPASRSASRRSVAASDSCRWVQVSSHISPSPPMRTVPACDWRSWKMKSIASPKGPEAASTWSSRHRPLPRGGRSLDQQHEQLQHRREQDHQDRRRDHVPLEGRVGEDLAAQAAGAGEEREARDPDRRGGGDPQRRRRSSAAPSAARPRTGSGAASGPCPPRRRPSPAAPRARPVATLR